MLAFTLIPDHLGNVGLIMPRLLNLVVAIYLIFTGLVGLGVLRMFHM